MTHPNVQDLVDQVDAAVQEAEAEKAPEQEAGAKVLRTIGWWRPLRLVALLVALLQCAVCPCGILWILSGVGGAIEVAYIEPLAEWAPTPTPHRVRRPSGIVCLAPEYTTRPDVELHVVVAVPTLGCQDTFSPQTEVIHALVSYSEMTKFAQCQQMWYWEDQLVRPGHGFAWTGAEDSHGRWETWSRLECRTGDPHCEEGLFRSGTYSYTLSCGDDIVASGGFRVAEVNINE